MPSFKTSQEWLERSSLLLRARPSTTRVVTKYSVKPLKKRKAKESSIDGAAKTETAIVSETPSTATHKATFTVKAYDPVSGVCLKYETSESKEVGRLMASLGRLGRIMAALPDASISEDIKMHDAAEITTPLPDQPHEPKPVDSKTTQNAAVTGGGGGGKKKKKGKK